MSKGLRLHTADGIIAMDPSAGILLAYGSTVPGSVAGYAPGCEFIRTGGNSLGTVRYINIGTKLVANFQGAGLSGAIVVTFVYGDAAAIDSPFFVADRAYNLRSAIVRPVVAGTDGGAVTAQIRKAASGSTIASGTALHSGSIDLKGTIDTNQVLTLAAQPAIAIASGNAIGLDVTGVTTAARGVVSIMLQPA